MRIDYRTRTTHIHHSLSFMSDKNNAIIKHFCRRARGKFSQRTKVIFKRTRKLKFRWLNSILNTWLTFLSIFFFLYFFLFLCHCNCIRWKYNLYSKDCDFEKRIFRRGWNENDRRFNIYRTVNYTSHVIFHEEISRYCSFRRDNCAVWISLLGERKQ